MLLDVAHLTVSRVCWQNNVHNHLTSARGYQLNKGRQVVDDTTLFGAEVLAAVDSAVQMNVDMKQASSYASFKLGVHCVADVGCSSRSFLISVVVDDVQVLASRRSRCATSLPDDLVG